MVNSYIFKEVKMNQYLDFQKGLGENLPYTIFSASFIKKKKNL